MVIVPRQWPIGPESSLVYIYINDIKKNMVIVPRQWHLVHDKFLVFHVW